MFHVFIFVLFTLLLTSMSLPKSNFVGFTLIGKPKCRTECGNLTVPYPFGMGKGCSLDESFELICNSTFNPPKLFIGSGKIQIYSISDSEINIFNFVAYSCYNESRDSTGAKSNITFDETSPFMFSSRNKFTVVGCDNYAWIRGPHGSNYESGCMGICTNVSNVPKNGKCSGIGCCQTSIPKGLKGFHITIGSFDDNMNVWSFNPCGFAFLAEENHFRFGGARDLSGASQLSSDSRVHILVDWVIGRGKRNCSQATECMGNSSCMDDEDLSGYRCSCNKGYQGNPYLHNGCQDINECEDNSTYPCYGRCINSPGNYSCTCLQGYEGDGKEKYGCRPVAKKSKFPVVVLSLVVVGIMLTLAGIIGIFFSIRKRKIMKLREKFFEQNGGLLLKQKLNSQQATYTVTIYNTEQLRKATDNYSNERIVGRGGFGVVYKGILPDKRVVAIKKSVSVGKTEKEQFINELLVITQIIHRNVVKLLGCCLEEEVPVLVYEFIPNNTLFHHIHNQEGGMSWLSWENRLRVAAEAASALGYLHSQAATPIIHRDVKSANILLDEDLSAKMSDFGISKLFSTDDKKVNTVVQGTLGYLDPEYIRTDNLNEKSDVYSFGVVLAELITGKKPLLAEGISQEKYLSNYFVKCMREDNLFQMVEPRILNEGGIDLQHLKAAAELANRCMDISGVNRPTMRAVERELEALRRSSTTHPSVPLEQVAHEEISGSMISEIQPADPAHSSLIAQATRGLTQV